MYELYQQDNVLAVRRKTLVSSIMPENGDGVAGGFTAQTRHQAEKDRANDFRLRAKTVALHKDSLNYKAVLRVSQKKGPNGEVVEEDGVALDAVPLETTATVQNGLDIETGNE